MSIIQPSKKTFSLFYCLTFILLCFNLSACINTPTTLSANQASLTSTSKIITIDGNLVYNKDNNPIFYVMLTPGPHTFSALFETYKWNYHCHFEFTARAQKHYEIVRQYNQHALTLYRKSQNNIFWVRRVDRVDPQYCEQKQKP